MSATAIPIPTPYQIPSSASEATIAATYRKVTWRLVPFLFRLAVPAKMLRQQS